MNKNKIMIGLFIFFMTLLISNNDHDNCIYVEAGEFSLSENTSGPPIVDIQTIEAPLYYTINYSETDIDSLAALVYFEAGNQSMEGKQLVADTVLNRVDSLYFPNTIKDVIYQSGQYSTAKKCKNFIAPIDCYGAVIQEMQGPRLNYDVIYFRPGHYHSCGAPMFKVDSHYFSGISKRLKEKELWILEQRDSSVDSL